MSEPVKLSEEFIGSDAYTVGFSKCLLNGESHFVPKYAEHRPNCKNVLQGKVPEPETHKMIHSVMKLRPGSMIHAGTFYGDMLPSFSRACPNTVYAFERVLENFVLASLCIEANGLDNVLLLNAALGSEFKITRVNIERGDGLHRGGASRISDKKGKVTPLMCIDQLQISDLSILQLDVEKYELPALQGAEATIRRCRPIIMIEDNKKNCASFLSSLSYSRIGSIPGLRIWASLPFKKMARDCLKETNSAEQIEVKPDI